MLRKWYDLMIQNKDELAKIITAESVSSRSWLAARRMGPGVARPERGKAPGFPQLVSCGLTCGPLMMRDQVIMVLRKHTC